MGILKDKIPMLKNSLRMAHVWMDEYIEKYYSLHPTAKDFDYGDISERIALRKKLGCKSFKWFLENVYPEILNNSSSSGGSAMDGRKYERWDQRKRNYLNKWQIQLTNTSLCVESEEEPNRKGARLIMSPCASITRQIFYQTDKDELILAKLLCLEASNKIPRMGKCHDMRGNQEWKVNRKEDVVLYNIAAGLCLAATEDRPGAYVDMTLCSTPSMTSWHLIDQDITS
ncbi:Polypeptide N-acetylgalactosaminyltransferase 35A [Armadillidium nasatum]|uniref:Polypeptide N-acetylgalactosaminyltransferase 35A n=1 Tax=Armadillidium nasatum TaxID=96803 RepID=A0A5N5SVG4_9CRUS|nr:Polypeptide N-acetylgalactosaminyltransferase 35A [Armadillidium nasatum]